MQMQLSDYGSTANHRRISDSTHRGKRRNTGPLFQRFTGVEKCVKPTVSWFHKTNRLWVSRRMATIMSQSAISDGRTDSRFNHPGKEHQVLVDFFDVVAIASRLVKAPL